MKSFFLIAVVFLCVGCEDKFETLREEYAERVDAQDQAIDEILVSVPELPEAPSSYTKLVDAKEKLRTLEAVAKSDSLEDSVRDIAKEQVELGNQVIAELQERSAIDESHKVSFVEGKDRNAFSILMCEDGSQSPFEDFRDRNSFSSSWYLTGPSYTNIEAARNWYKQFADMEYLLVIRQIDIIKPKHLGQDTSGNEEFRRGAIECNAYLFELKSKQMIHSFHFIAPNQANIASMAGFEFFLPPEPEDAIGVLTTRLYGVAHDFATAIAAELSENVTAKYHIERDLLGVRLELNE